MICITAIAVATSNFFGIFVEMTDLIHLLPDAIANQIAAGEVVQRPASVVKELMENTIDAGAGDIKLIVKDAGKMLIQVIDNGCGMSERDARMCFERHATSKIHKADDLLAIQTLGFRGEALASIANQQLPADDDDEPENSDDKKNAEPSPKQKKSFKNWLRSFFAKAPQPGGADLEW